MKLVDLLKNVDPRYEKDVKSICDKWKKKVQEGLKDMMRFSMAKDIKVVFDVNAAYPEYFSKIDFTDDEYKKFILFQNRHDILSLDHYLNRFSKFCNKNYPLNQSDSNNLTNVNNLVTRIIQQTPNDDEFYKKIENFNEDILGVYLIKKKRQFENLFTDEMYNDYNSYYNIELNINLFWAVIGLFSERYELNLEAVTVTILSHEYAHAYSHVGIDANEQNWLTSFFIRSDKRIKEGIAEYFSKKFMYENNDSLNRFSEAYDVLLEKSPQIYKEYVNWENPSLEALRFALLQVRNNKNITSYNEFLQILKDGKKRYPI